MPYKPVDEKSIGLYREKEVLQGAFVVAEKGKLSIKRLFEIPLTETAAEDVKPLYIDPDEKELNLLTDKYLTVSGLSGAEVLVRRLRLKLTKEKDIDEVFAFQAEPLLPYPIDQAIVDKWIVDIQEGTSQLTLLAAKKEYIQKHLEQFHKLGIDPEVVSCEPIALAALIACLADTVSTQFVVHIGKNSTLCLLLKEGKLLASHVHASGWEALYQALQRDRSDQPPSPVELYNMDLAQLDPASHPALQQAIEALLQNIQWLQIAQEKETKIKETSQVLVTGEGANLQGMQSIIATRLNLPLQELKSPNPNEVPLTKLNAFALPIGLALSVEPQFGPSINFRRQELAYSKPWKRFQTPLLIYAGLCVLLAAALYLFELSYVSYREDELKSRYLTLLSLVQKPYADFEKQYETKYPSEKPEEGILPVEALTAGTLNQRLDYLEKEIRAIPDTFPLLPNTPRVSDVLAWLSTHPQLTCTEATKENGECPSFTIDTFNYTMVKRPELNKKSEKYQIKIDLEFSTSSPRLAREFHDALIAPNDFVDPKGEIKWNATKGKYRTSFYLKDKTAYPSALKEM